MRLSHTILMTAVIVAATFAAHTAKAADAAAPAPAATGLKVAIIDDQRLLAESKAAKNIDSQLSAKQESFQKEFVTLEKKLNDKKKELIQSNGKIKPEDFDKKRIDFEAEVAKAQNTAKNRRADLAQAGNEGLGKLRAQITKIVADMAQKNGYNIVLTRQNVVLADKAMDITTDVLAELDKTLTSVPLNFDQPAKAAAAAPAAEAKPADKK
jgi:Skp family chaperone for outer membrane proteins